MWSLAFFLPVIYINEILQIGVRLLSLFKEVIITFFKK